MYISYMHTYSMHMYIRLTLICIRIHIIQFVYTEIQLTLKVDGYEYSRMFWLCVWCLKIWTDYRLDSRVHYGIGLKGTLQLYGTGRKRLQRWTQGITTSMIREKLGSESESLGWYLVPGVNFRVRRGWIFSYRTVFSLLLDQSFHFINN